MLIELQGPPTTSAEAAARLADIDGVTVDEAYEPVPMGSGATATHVVRAAVDDRAESALRAAPGVVGVWRDGPAAPFQS
jgi:hypothetical protein